MIQINVIIISPPSLDYERAQSLINSLLQRPSTWTSPAHVELELKIRDEEATLKLKLNASIPRKDAFSPFAPHFRERPERLSAPQPSTHSVLGAARGNM